MKRALALILALTMVMALVACGGDKPTSSTPSNPTQSEKPSTPTEPSKPSEPEKPAEPAKPAEPKIMKRAFNNAAANASALIDNSNASGEIQSLIFGKLYATMPIDGKAVLGPQLAASEPVDVNGDGKTWNITVSDKAMFENGEKITADTFMYSWKMGLDPKLVLAKASTLAKSSYIEIVNAVDYYSQGKEGAAPVAWEDVGFKKIDEMTLQITTKVKVSKTLVMRHFSAAVTSPIYEPVFTACLSADGTTTTYGSSADKVIGSGPYKLTNWVIGSVREFEKNENFIRADLIKIDKMQFVMAEDANTRLQLFEKGDIDTVSLDAAGVEKYGDDPRVVVTPSNTVYIVEFNTDNPDKPILKNENFRKALYYATNRVELAKMTEKEPSSGVIGLKCTPTVDGTTFRQLADKAGYLPANYGYDPTLAKQLFDEAMKEEGLTTLELTLQHKAGDSFYDSMAEYLQESWQNLFGKDIFKLSLNPLPSSQNTANRKAWRENPSCYEICIANWGLAAATRDALGALQVYTDNYKSRNAPYCYDVLEQLYAEGNTDENRLNDNKRTELAMEMEKYIIEHGIMVPLVHDVDYSLIADRVITPLENWDVDLGFSFPYADIAQ